ncbi:MAG: nitroreductase family protein [Polyangiales bacterium]
MTLGHEPLDALLREQPAVASFLGSVGLLTAAAEAHAEPLASWLESLPDEVLLDAGMDRQQMLGHIMRLVSEVAALSGHAGPRLRHITVIGGRDKTGASEPTELTLHVGQVVCIVGPTGSGKSRLLADIECLAQADTPTGRRVLVDGHAPSDDQRFSLDKKLVAQLSQNMSFVVDMTVGEFVVMHACCRQLPNPELQAERVITCANELTGEQFSADTPVTQLSGGQSRALMIADVALLSAAPIVLIDEIENAGVDRRRALDLLIRGEKIVLISTHDPLLALRGDARIVIRNGGISEVIVTSDAERANRERVEVLDGVVMDLRARLRSGERIDVPVQLPTLDADGGQHHPGLALLLGRRSCHKLREPSPSPEELGLILRAALRAPDFRQLQPYRFIAARGDGLDRLGAAMRRAAEAGGQPSHVVDRAAHMPHRAPLVLVVVASPKPDAYAPVFDQQLSAASTVLMMQLAARALGFGGVWRSGWFMHSAEFHRELALAEGEQIVGFLYLGTPMVQERPLAPIDPSTAPLFFL